MAVASRYRTTLDEILLRIPRGNAVELLGDRGQVVDASAATRRLWDPP